MAVRARELLLEVPEMYCLIFVVVFLKEKCWSKPIQQLSFKYFMNYCFILELLAIKVSQIQTIHVKCTYLHVTGMNMYINPFMPAL